MSRVEQITEQIKQLSGEELESLRKWFADLDWEAWDREFEVDANAGKFDALVREALEDQAKGRTTSL